MSQYMLNVRMKHVSHDKGKVWRHCLSRITSHSLCVHVVQCPASTEYKDQSVPDSHGNGCLLYSVFIIMYVQYKNPSDV